MSERNFKGNLHVTAEVLVSIAGTFSRAKKYEAPYAGSGIYFLFDHAGECLYVGQSHEVATRIAVHARAKLIQFKTWTYMYCPAENLHVVEAFWIRLLTPKCNGSHPRNSELMNCSARREDVARMLTRIQTQASSVEPMDEDAK